MPCTGFSQRLQQKQTLCGILTVCMLHTYKPRLVDYLQCICLTVAVAESLVRSAKDGGSGDNITVIVVFLKDDLSVPVPTEKPKESVEDNVR